MRKIRSIKPEALEDRCTACLSHEAFRLWVGLTLLADDDGLVRAAPGYLLGAVFWGQPPETPLDELIAELAAAQLAQPYQAEGDDYLALTRWRQHQRITSPHPSSLPRPPSMAPAAGAVARSGRGAVTRLARKAMISEQAAITAMPDHDDHDDHFERSDDQKVIIDDHKAVINDQKVIIEAAPDDQKVIIEHGFDDQSVITDHQTTDRRGEERKGKERIGEDRMIKLDHPAATAAQRLTQEQIDQVYAVYPRKVSKSRGYRVLSKVRASRLPDLLRAAANYAASAAGKELQYVKQFGTWASEWEDWVDYVEPPRRLSRGITISPPATHTHDVDLGSVL